MMRSKIKRARDMVEALRVALLCPAAEDICLALPGLEEAAGCLETVERELREGACAPDEVQRELKLLKNDLRISRRLIEQGTAFWQGWAKRTGAGPAYTQAGRTALPEHLAGSRGTLSLRG